MSNWPMIPLEKIARRITERNTEGNSNVLTISAQRGLVSQRQYFNKDIASQDLSNYYLLHKGDFAYNKSYSEGYPVGAIKRLNQHEKGIVSPLYICFRVERTEQADPAYLAHFFESGLFEADVRAIAKEGARNHGLLNVRPSEFLALPIPLPPVSEQRKIAAILTSIDEMIEVSRAIVEQLELVKKSLMADLLTNGIPGRHTQFRDTELGRIPDTWEVRPLEQWLIRVIDYRGQAPPKHHEGTTLITAKNVRSGTINPVPREYIADSDYVPWMKRGIPEAGDVLFTTEAPLGNAAPVPAEPIALGQRIVTLCPDKRVLDHGFLLWAVLAPPFQALLHSKATGSTVKGIRQSTLRSLPFAVPPMGEQLMIASLIQSAAERCAAEEVVLGQLIVLKSALMFSLLTGELRAPTDEFTV